MASSSWPVCHFLTRPCVASSLRHMLFSWLAVCPSRALPCVIFMLSHMPITICTHVLFLLDRVFVSHSPACQFRTTTCLKPGYYTCQLHVDVHTDPFHHRTTNDTTFLVRESTPQSIKLQQNKFMRQPNKFLRPQKLGSRSRHPGSSLRRCTRGVQLCPKDEIILFLVLLELLILSYSSL